MNKPRVTIQKHLTVLIFKLCLQGEKETEVSVGVSVRSEDSVGFAIARLAEALKTNYRELFLSYLLQVN